MKISQTKNSAKQAMFLWNIFAILCAFLLDYFFNKKLRAQDGYYNLLAAIVHYILMFAYLGFLTLIMAIILYLSLNIFNDLFNKNGNLKFSFRNFIWSFYPASILAMAFWYALQHYSFSIAMNGDYFPFFIVAYAGLQTYTFGKIARILIVRKEKLL